MSAAFDAAYGIELPRAAMPATLATLTIVPAPDACIGSFTARAQ
jgi:hypothetical protein